MERFQGTVLHLQYRVASAEAELAAVVGDELSWERLDNRRASRVAVYRSVVDVPPIDENPALSTWAIDTMVRWNDVLRPVIKALHPAPPTPMDALGSAD